VLGQQCRGLPANTPHLLDRYSGEKAMQLAADSAVNPEGFCHVEAILATTLVGARPTEKVMPSSVSRFCLMRAAMPS
jgi:hypothetical protein